LSSGLSLGSGIVEVTFWAQPTKAQAHASAIESFKRTLYLHPQLRLVAFSRVAKGSLPEPRQHEPSMYSCCEASMDSQTVESRSYPADSIFQPRNAAIRSEEDSMEAEIDTLDAFGGGGLTIESPTAITDRMHALLVIRADRLKGRTEVRPREPLPGRRRRRIHGSGGAAQARESNRQLSRSAAKIEDGGCASEVAALSYKGDQPSG
jgi:hypothetical protein